MNRHKQPTIPKGKTTEPLPGDTGWGDIVNRLVPYYEARGASVVPGSLDTDGLDIEQGSTFISLRYASNHRAWIVVDGQIVGEARLDGDLLTIVERIGDVTTESTGHASDDRPVSDQWPTLPVALPVDAMPVTLRLCEANGWGEYEYLDPND